MAQQPGLSNDTGSKRRHRVSPALTFFLAVFLLAWAALAWWQTEWSRLERIDVIGEEEVSRAQVLELVSPYLGDALWSVSLGEIRGRVSELPRVKNLELQRQWPDAIELRVFEREEGFLLPWEGETFAVCREGVVLDTVNWEEQERTLPVLTGTGLTSEPQPGDKLEKNAVQELTKRYQEFPSDFWEQVAEVHLEGEEIIFVDQTGVKIHFGEAERVETKVEMLKAAYREANRPLDTINVKAGDKAHVTFKE